MVFSAAPTYVMETLGRFYCSTTGPLYNAGSRTPGDAGLFHYTTQIGQTKDGQETGSPNNVNIGCPLAATRHGWIGLTRADELQAWSPGFSGWSAGHVEHHSSPAKH